MMQSEPTPANHPAPLGGSTALVTGANGFIGRRLTAALNAQGARVVGVGRTDRCPECESWVAADLTDPDATVRVIADVAPDVVFHLAGMVSTETAPELVVPFLQSNLLATVHVLEAVRRAGTSRLVIAGSAEELSAEREPRVPTSPYAAAKAAGTLYARMYRLLYGLPVTIVRLYMGYGPGQPDSKLIPHVALSLLRGEEASVRQPDRVCDIIHVDDIASGLIAALDPALEGGTWDVGTGRGVLIRDIVCELERIVGRGSVHMPDRTEPVTGSWLADLGRHGIRGWEPQVDLHTGLTETVADLARREGIAWQEGERA